MKKRINMRKDTKRKNFLLAYVMCFILLLGVLIVTTNNVSKADDTNATNSGLEVVESSDTLLAYNRAKTEDCVYLSNIEYIKNQTATSWDQIRYDEVNGGGKITVKIENNSFSFEKGIWAHATSQITYDLSAYDYKYFTAFVGMNLTTSKGNGVKFTISTSKDGSTWVPQVQDLLKKPRENATFVKVDISDAKYLRLYANDNGSNANDHSVYADAKLVNEIDESSSFASVEEYDNIIKTKFANQTDITGEFEYTLLKRELVKSVGQYTLNSIYNASNENKEAIDWLMNNQDVLKLYMLGGAPDGGYYNSLTQLSRLYYNYKEDFNNTTLLNNKWYPNMTYGDLYKKMAITLSLTHGQLVGLWMQSSAKENQSDAVRRYAIFKYLHKNGKLKATDNVNMTPIFEALQVEEMRYIMNNSIDDEEILWLNDYVQSKIDAEPGRVWSYLTPHPYMAYVWPNYSQDLYYSEENRDYFNELFAVPDKNNKDNKIGMFDLSYTIPGGKENPEYTIKITRGTVDYKLYKVWMNLRNKFGTGAVCGGISKTGSNIRTTHGMPATVIGQPGHAALLYYSKNEAGKAAWGIDNDVSGWTLSEKGERLLLGWGNGSYAKGSYQVVYMQLGQEAINDYDNLVKAEELVKLADVYSNDSTKQEEIYRKALSVQSINFDAWLGLIDLYNRSTTKSEEDYYKLAEEVATNMKYFPLPMYHLQNLIKPKLTSIEYVYRFTLLQTRALTESSQVQNSDTTVVQPSLTRTEANFLLGKIDKSIATFSFDGENAEKIVLSSRFDGNGIRWDYSLDGKNTWNEVSFTGDEPHQLQLTKEQIASITAENDIYVHIVGVNYNEENLYKIDITEGTLPQHNGGDYLFGNDLENRVVGVDLTMEWRMTESDPWTSYATSSPDLTGNKTVQVRVGATGTKLPSPFATYTFTQDNQPDTRKYIPVSHLTMTGVSSQATSNQGSAAYAIDGNYNTRWHSAWNGTDRDKFIIIKFDRRIVLSAMDYVPAGGGNGKILKAQILGSADGENFTEITQVDWANNDEIKTIDFETPVELEYIKIVGLNTSSASSLSFIAAKAFNFYQDITKNPHPTAGIGYSTTEKTNKDVVARLVNPSTTIKITNNDGKDTYTFTKNGEFTFEFIDEATGLTGSAKAKVNWIDKTAPSARIEYSTTNPTNHEVSAKLIPSEEVTIITENNATGEENQAPNNDPFMVTFDDNGEYTFYFQDAAGNTGSATAKVTWIDKEAPRASIAYSTKDKTSENVIVTLTNYSEDITITNNGGKNSYVFTENGEFTFEFRDKAGNTGSVKAVVTWIDKTIDNTNNNNGSNNNSGNNSGNNSNNNGNNSSNNNGNNNSSNTNGGTYNPSGNNGNNKNNNNNNNNISDNNSSNNTTGDNNSNGSNNNVGDNNAGNNGTINTPVVDNKESETSTRNVKPAKKSSNTWKIILVLILIILVIIISEIRFEKPKKEIPIAS